MYMEEEEEAKKKKKSKSIYVLAKNSTFLKNLPKSGLVSNLKRGYFQKVPKIRSSVRYPAGAAQTFPV